MKWDMNAYISFLNANNRSVFHRSEPVTRTDPFRPHQTSSTGIDDLLSDEELETEMSGLDVYDPAFEEDLNALPDSSLT